MILVKRRSAKTANQTLLAKLRKREAAKNHEIEKTQIFLSFMAGKIQRPFQMTDH